MKGRKKDFLYNIASLGIVNILNKALPLVLVPYITLVLGVTNFGIYSFIVSFMSYIDSFVDFGFSLTGVQMWVYCNKSQTFSAVQLIKSITIIKVFLLALSTLFIIILHLLGWARFSILFYFLVLGYPLGNILSFDWIYKGIGKIYLYAFAVMIGKLVYTFLVFVFIKSSSDLPLLFFLYSINFLATGIVSIIILKREEVDIIGALFARVGYRDILMLVKKTYINAANVLLSIMYKVNNIFIVGLFISDEYILGLYSVSYKITTVIYSLSSAIAQSAFSHVASIFQKSTSNIKRWIYKILWLNLLIHLIGTVILYISSSWIINILFSYEYSGAAWFLRGLSLFLIANSVTSIINGSYYVMFNKSKYLLRNNIVAILIVVFFAFVFKDNRFFALGLTVAEFCVAVWALYDLNRMSVKDRQGSR